MSRPSESVPRRCSPKGGRNGRPTIRNGSVGKKSGAESDTKTTRPRKASPNAAGRLRTKRRQKSRVIARPSPHLNARVERGVDEVDHEVDHDHEARREEQDSEQQVEVAGKQRLEGERAEPGPGKHRFDHDGPA